MFGKKTVTPQVENAVAKAVNYEVTVADIARRSEKRAWIVAWMSILMALILAGGYFYFLPLKEKVPYLVMADAYTGTVTIARLRDDFANPTIAASEALNKSNISHFIMARESYDFSQIGERDWSTVFAMGTPQVTSGYKQLYDSTNRNNPITLFGKTKTVRVKILSMQLHGPSNTDEKIKTATARFQRTLYNKESGSSEPLDSKIATIEFLYKSNLKMDEANRVLNPLGFQVTGYRVDNDYAASPPVNTGSEFPVPTQAAPAPAAVPGQPVDPNLVPAAPQPGMPAGTVPAGTVPAGAPAPNTVNPATPPAAPAPTGNANGVSTR